MRTIMHHPSGGNSKTPLAYINDGQRCIGFILSRGKLGFELFDAEQRSLGTYPTQSEAANALSLVKEGG